MYNVLSGSTSSELYGTEPWTFYFVNGFLNLNVAFPMGLLGLLFAVVCGSVGLPKKKATFELTPIWYLSPLVVWIAIFFPQAHKEERFIFPVYPLICLSASYALLVSTRLISKLASKIVSFSIRTPLKLLSQLVYVVFLLVSMSRTAALYKGYHAPMKIYQHVAELEATTPSRLCVGKEWYRFSSSFFLPKNNALSIEFIKSGYDGLLPKPFSAVNGTSIIPTHMNNMNAEEPTRYVDLDTCDYIVDQETGSPNYRSQAEWAEQVCYPFLDPARSNGLFRAFYIPFLSEKKTEHNAYCLLKRAQ